MSCAPGIWKPYETWITNKLYFEFQRFQSRAFSTRKFTIHFSNRPEWIIPILRGMACTRHEVNFGGLTPDFLRDCDFFVPLTMDDLKHLAQFPDQVAHFPIPIPSMESLLLCDEKIRLNQMLGDNGFGSHIPRTGRDLPLPFILKRNTGEFGKECHLVTSDQAKDAHSDKLDSPEYFTQELIAGPVEYATHILFKNGKILRSLNIEYHFSTAHPIKGKEQASGLKVCRCPHLDLFASILRMLGFEGLCCFNYKVRDQRPFLLEINPRFGGSLCPYFFSFLRQIE